MEDCSDSFSVDVYRSWVVLVAATSRVRLNAWRELLLRRYMHVLTLDASRYTRSLAPIAEWNIAATSRVKLIIIVNILT